MTDESTHDDGGGGSRGTAGSPDPAAPSEPARPSGRERLRSAAGRARRASRDLDGSPGVLSAVKRLRGVLPGDAHFGDPLSLGGTRHAEAAGRTVVGLTERPGVFREIGLGGIQLWQAVLERFGAGSGEHEVTLVFTDLVDFSRWSLAAGDEEAARVLRRVSEAWEKPVTERSGTVVKRLGDGMMAAFAEARTALDAVVDARDRLRGVDADGWTPSMRAGLHLGRPRRVGSDFLGVAVNTAARLGDAGKAGEILVSGDLLERLDRDALDVRRRRRGLNLKGAPDDLTVWAVEPR